MTPDKETRARNTKKRRREKDKRYGAGGSESGERPRRENRDAFAILRSVVRAYCVGGQRGRQNVKCGRIARWEREIEQKRGRGKKLNPRDFIGALPTATVSFWQVIPSEDANGNQEFASAGLRASRQTAAAACGAARLCCNIRERQ